MSNKKEKKLTPQQVKKIVEEVNAWNGLISSSIPKDYRILSITHLWELSGECYQVRYTNYVSEVFRRDTKTQKLRGVLRTSYFAPHWTDNPRFGQPTPLEQEIEKRLQ